MNDFCHVPGRTVSPCRDYEKRLPGYACLRTCNLPGRYSISLGTMSGSVPANMTPQGRQLSFISMPAPGNSALYSVVSKVQQRAARGGWWRTRKTPRSKRRCRFYGCEEMSHGVYCRRHYQAIYMRIVVKRWPARLAYAPLDPGRNLLAELQEMEATGLLAKADWYNAAMSDYAAGFMRFRKKTRRRG